MTISRGQMKRQLYEGGGIMSLSKEGIGGGDYKGIDMGSRVGYGLIKKVFRGAKKAVKGVTGAVKDIASSDVGKAALAGAAMYYAPGFGIKAQGGLAPFLQGAKTGIGNFLLGTPGDMGGRVAGTRFGGLGKLFSKIPGGGVTAAIGGASLLAGLLSKQQMAEIDEADPDERGDIVAEKLRQSLTRLGVSGEELERRVAEGVSEYTGYTSKAEGGRIGYALGSMTGINTDKLKEDASGILDILGKNTPFGIAKMMVEKTQGNEAQIKNFIKKLLKNTPPGQVINFITDRYKIPESIASRMVVNQMADANMPIDPSGSTDEGFPSRPEFESSAEDTSVIPIKNRRDEFDKRLEMEIKDRFERRPIQPLDRFEGGEPIQPLDKFEGGEPIQPLDRFTQEEIEDMVDRLRKMDPSDMPSIPLPEGRFEDDGLYDNEKKYYPNTYDPKPRYLNQGGRIGFALGGNELPPDPTTPVNPFKPKPIGPVLPNKEMASNEISIDKIEMLIKRGADNDLIKEFTGASDGVINQIRDAMERKNKAGGGIMNRAGYALGDTASQNAMQAAGIEGLPMRQNPKGVKELDLRDNGGFIPPVGIKEKEDDIPAMLSNNEFVFTADAVRGMGDGDVELGAQRMYDQMKMLEKGGRV